MKNKTSHLIVVQVFGCRREKTKKYSVNKVPAIVKSMVRAQLVVHALKMKAPMVIKIATMT